MAVNERREIRVFLMEFFMLIRDDLVFLREVYLLG